MKGWHFQVDKFISEIDASNVLISVKLVMRIIQNKLSTLDQNLFLRDLNDDRRNIKGSKLRTFRLYKKSVQTEQYVSCQLPRTTRRCILCFFHYIQTFDVYLWKRHLF
jgi:hypothetical protein